MTRPNTRPFDAAEYLDDEEMIAEYLAIAAEDPDPNIFILAIGNVARARGMTDIAEKSGLGRESLYKALTPGAHPRFETVVKVARALGVHFTTVVAPPPKANILSKKSVRRPRTQARKSVA